MQQQRTLRSRRPRRPELPPLGRRRESRRAGRGSLREILALAILVACGSTPDEEHSATAPVVLASGLQPIAPDARPALRALAAAIQNDEDELAAQVLARLKRQPLGESERAIIAGYERILIGRGLVKTIRFELTTEPDGKDEYRVLLRLRQESGTTLRLRLPPADLSRLQVGVDAGGLEGRDYESGAVLTLTDLEMPPGVELELELGRAVIQLGRAVAVRDRWHLTLRSGEIQRGDQTYPAGRLPRPTHERILLTPEAESDPSTVEELVEAIADGEVPPASVLLIAVRLPGQRREDALRGLSPLVQRLAAEDPARVRAVAPSLRWVTRTRDPGSDPRTWAEWLESWSVRAEQTGARPRLELPGRASGRDSGSR